MAFSNWQALKIWFLSLLVLKGKLLKLKNIIFCRTWLVDWTSSVIQLIPPHNWFLNCEFEWGLERVKLKATFYLYMYLISSNLENESLCKTSSQIWAATILSSNLAFLIIATFKNKKWSGKLIIFALKICYRTSWQGSNYHSKNISKVVN